MVVRGGMVKSGEAIVIMVMLAIKDEKQNAQMVVTITPVNVFHAKAFISQTDANNCYYISNEIK